jgi:hypothetical protein
MRDWPVLQAVVWDTAAEHERITRSRGSRGEDKDGGGDDAAIPVVKCR